MTYTERKEQVKSFLGRTVTVEIDRPIGAEHPKHPGLIYPINYGFIPGVIGGDSEELDVYVLGIPVPVKTAEVRVIGIIHRRNDVEDKLVAAPDGMAFYQNEIAEAVSFQERYYDTKTEALYQKSCGAAVYRETNAGREYLLLFQHRSKTWSFPKGHMEPGETELKTAEREIYEETGLRAVIEPGFREEVRYTSNSLFYRLIVLFSARATGALSPDLREVEKAVWVTADEAERLLGPCYLPVIDRLRSCP